MKRLHRPLLPSFPARRALPIVLLLGLVVSLASEARAQSSYVLFEGGPVRPIALAPDGTKLFVANAPENHLEIFDVGPSGTLTPAGSVPVGLEPVAVGVRSASEVWVVNHLSDSVSIVDVASQPARVVRTLLVGDEPRDIVFAGSPQRAFVSTAHRGQHRTHASLAGVPSAGDPQLTTPGIGRADVWVFDAAAPGIGLGGRPIGILSFFADTPRALATDGTTVYVAAFHSGNRTTSISETVVPDGFATACNPNGTGAGVPGPAADVNGAAAPETGLIVRFDGADWRDALGCSWNAAVAFDLPDHDVFAVNANTLARGVVFDHVGTILFNLAVNPTTGRVYASNTESPNHIRFEGPGVHGGSTVQGQLSRSRVSVLDPTGPSVDVQHLNQHIDYGMLHTDPGADHAAIDAQVPHSLATPLQMVVDDAAQKVYLAAFGSARVGVFDVSALEDPSFEANFDPTVQSADDLATGGGPAGLALDPSGERLFVYTRFANQVEVYDVGGAPGPPIQVQKLPTAEPPEIVEGRPFLYDAVATSGNGEASCASCHVFGDLDSLAWNLGDPDGSVSTNNQPSASILPPAPTFHPMKGPMTTQTLRGLSTHGATHWRGDRLDGFFGTDPCEGSPSSNAPCDEAHSFRNFIVAFEGLVGRETPIDAADMQRFTDFALRLTLPPNPVRPLDNAISGDAAAGHDVYFGCGPGRTECSLGDPGVTDTVEDCDGCHDLAPELGFFGTAGEQSFEGEPQNFKVAHLRNMVQKIGMFGTAGDQVRGFGFLHDGSVDTMKTFLASGVFSLTNTQERQLEQFMLAFPTDLAPIVGQQASLGPGNPGSTNAGSDARARMDLLEQRAATPFDSFVFGPGASECDLVVKTVEGGVAKGYLRQAGGSYLPDDGGPAISAAALRDKADPGGDAQDLHLLCAPSGSGPRLAIDRDEDSVLDGLDNCPAWPNGAAIGSCTAGDPERLATRCTSAAECGVGGSCSLAQEDGDGDGVGDACEPVLLPEPGFGAALGIAAAGLMGVGARRGRRSGRLRKRPDVGRRRHSRAVGLGGMPDSGCMGCENRPLHRLAPRGDAAAEASGETTRHRAASPPRSAPREFRSRGRRSMLPAEKRCARRSRASRSSRPGRAPRRDAAFPARVTLKTRCLPERNTNRSTHADGLRHPPGPGRLRLRVRQHSGPSGFVATRSPSRTGFDRGRLPTSRISVGPLVVRLAGTCTITAIEPEGLCASR